MMLVVLDDLKKKKKKKNKMLLGVETLPDSAVGKLAELFSGCVRIRRGGLTGGDLDLAARLQLDPGDLLAASADDCRSRRQKDDESATGSDEPWRQTGRTETLWTRCG